MRERVQEILRQSEHGFVTRVAAAWQRIAEMFGYRLRSESGATYETVATLASATMRGLILMGLSTPDIRDSRTSTQPFGATQRADWSVPALGAAAIASSFLEPDPTITWDDERIAAVRQALDTLTIPTG